MTTREELLRGVVKVNGERTDQQTAAHSSAAEVHGDGESGDNQSPGESGARKAPAKAPVPRAQESLQDFVTRRKDEVLAAIEEAEDAQARINAELKGVRLEIAKHTAELKKIEAIQGGIL
jgi:hypothetical protein